MIPAQSNDSAGDHLAGLTPTALTSRRHRTNGVKPPKVYAAIIAVAAELAKKGIAKSGTNAEEQYQFRSIDDVYNRLSPALVAHRLCILPRVLERSCVERNGSNESLLVSVSLKVAFDLVSAEDGSVHVIESYGEALDGGDKATSKAMTAAFKYAVIQAFCIPVAGQDADATSHHLRKSEHVPEPVQGWEQWMSDMSDVVRVCESGEALEGLQNTNRALLRGMSRERPDLYTRIGETIRERRLSLAQIEGAPTRVETAALSVDEGSFTRKSRSSRRRPREAKANGGEAHA